MGKVVLGARDEPVKERCMEVYKEEKIKVKQCICQREKQVNKQFGVKLNQDIDENRNK